MMQHYSLDKIKEMDRFFRANFINSLTGFKSPVLIGTSNLAGKENLAIFNNLVHIGANPALIGFVNRPREAAPHTLSNIENTGVYTINHVSSDFIYQAHQTSAKYPQGISEFEKTGLTAERLGDCVVPFVKESPIKYSLTLKEVIPVNFNHTFFVIGAITDIYLHDTKVEDDGCLDFEGSDIVASLGICEYYGINKISKLPYAKP